MEQLRFLGEREEKWNRFRRPSSIMFYIMLSGLCLPEPNGVCWKVRVEREWHPINFTYPRPTQHTLTRHVHLTHVANGKQDTFIWAK